jgi:hypothetical protein
MSGNLLKAYLRRVPVLVVYFLKMIYTSIATVEEDFAFALSISSCSLSENKIIIKPCKTAVIAREEFYGIRKYYIR